jgi:hypothetical protein
MSSDMAASFTHPKNKSKKKKKQIKKKKKIAKHGTMWCHPLRYHQYTCAFEGINFIFLATN